MDKFKRECPENSWSKQFHSTRHLKYFAFKGKVYPLGVPIRLTFSGECFCKYFRDDGPFTISEHYFMHGARDDTQEYFAVDYYPADKDRKLLPVFSVDNLEKFVEDVYAEPADISYEEYVNYINNFTNTHCDNALTLKEEREFAKLVKAGVPPKLAVPERFKGRDLEELNLKPKYNDFNCPGMITSWVLFIIFVFATGIFKDWYIQLILNAYGALVFIGYRQRKLWGFS